MERKDLTMREFQQKLCKQASAFMRDEKGVAAIEYALIAAATGLALAASLPSIQSGLSTTYNAIEGYF